MRTEVILQHGWGFDGSIWRQWAELLRADGAVVHIGERGYFEAPPTIPLFSRLAERRIAIVHSLGLHLLSKQALTTATTIVIFNGFLEFHPTEPTAAKRSRRILKSMRDKFAEAPAEVLLQFMANCYAPQPAPLQIDCHMDVQLLADDLELLDENRLDRSLLAGKRLCVIHGQHDAIVPPSVAHAIAPRVHLLPGGHALPFTQMDACVDLVRESFATGSFVQPVSTPPGVPTNSLFWNPDTNVSSTDS
jgi:pimeloyl-ACP methyl ester carboxylesterase